MMQQNSKITNGQHAAVIVTYIIGVGILSLPSTLAEEVGTDGWQIILLGGIILTGFVYIITKLGSMFEGETVIEYSKKLIPKPFPQIISFIFFVYFTVLSAYLVRVSAEVVKMFLLSNTPTEVLIVAMLLTTGYLARKGIESIARIAQIIIPVVSIPLLILGISVLSDVHFDNILPVFKTNILDIIKALPIVFFSYSAFDVGLFTMAYVDDTKKSLKFNLIAVWIVVAIYISVFFVTLARFGVVELKHLIWPTLTLMKTIEIPGAFIENVEGVVMALWVLLVISTVVVYYYISSLTASKILKNKEYYHFVYPILPIIYIISLIPDNLATVYDYMDIFMNYVGTLLTIIIPIIFFLLAYSKKQKKGSQSQNE